MAPVREPAQPRWKQRADAQITTARRVGNAVFVLLVLLGLFLLWSAPHA